MGRGRGRAGPELLTASWPTLLGPESAAGRHRGAGTRARHIRGAAFLPPSTAHPGPAVPGFAPGLRRVASLQETLRLDLANQPYFARRTYGVRRLEGLEDSAATSSLRRGPLSFSQRCPLPLLTCGPRFFTWFFAQPRPLLALPLLGAPQPLPAPRTGLETLAPPAGVEGSPVPATVPLWPLQRHVSSGLHPLRKRVRAAYLPVPTLYFCSDPLLHRPTLDAEFPILSSHFHSHF